MHERIRDFADRLCQEHPGGIVAAVMYQVFGHGVVQALIDNHEISRQLADRAVIILSHLRWEQENPDETLALPVLIAHLAAEGYPEHKIIRALAGFPDLSALRSFPVGQIDRVRDLAPGA